MSGKAPKSWAGSFSIVSRSGMNSGGASISSRLITKNVHQASSTRSYRKRDEVRSNRPHQYRIALLLNHLSSTHPFMPYARQTASDNELISRRAKE